MLYQALTKYSHDDEKEYISMKYLNKTLSALKIEITHLDYMIMKLFEISDDLDNLPIYEIYMKFVPEFKTSMITDFKKSVKLNPMEFKELQE